MSEERKAKERVAAGDTPGFQPFDPAAIEPYIVKDPEALTVNFARTVEQLGKACRAVLAISSPVAGDGKTITSINLACTLAQDASTGLRPMTASPAP